MEQPLSRRAWLSSLASGASALVLSSCGSSAGVRELDTPEGRVLQWEDDDLLVLVSGIQPTYRTGDAVQLTLLANNQTRGVAQVKLRTRLLGRGDQAVVEDQVATLTVAPEDAASVERTLPLPRSLPPGEYTVSVEVPPWSVNGRETGRGAALRTRIQVVPGE